MSDVYDGPVGEFPSLAATYRKFDAAAEAEDELRKHAVQMEQRAKLAERDLHEAYAQRDHAREELKHLRAENISLTNDVVEIVAKLDRALLERDTARAVGLWS